MVHTTCAVRDCKSSSRINKDLRFHQLPRTEERCKLWVEACKRPDLLEMTFGKIKNTYICSLHFENGMYGKKCLKKTAIPTLLLPTKDSVHTQTEPKDHFDLPNDMENYIRYHIMGSVSQIRMKPGCLPTRFECQLDANKLETEQNIQTKRKMLRNEEGIENDSCTKQLDSAGPSSENSGSVGDIKIKKDCVPSRFDCQENGRKREALAPRKTSKKRRKKLMLGEESGMLEVSCSDKLTNPDVSVSTSNQQVLSEGVNKTSTSTGIYENLAENEQIVIKKENEELFESLPICVDIKIETNEETDEVTSQPVLEQSSSRQNILEGTRETEEKKKGAKKKSSRKVTCSAKVYENALATGVNVIIARVYQFLKKEYDYLTKTYGGLLDLTPFSKYMERTAEATGFNISVVEKALTSLKKSVVNSKGQEENSDTDSCDEKFDTIEDRQTDDTETSPTVSQTRDLRDQSDIKDHYDSSRIEIKTEADPLMMETEHVESTDTSRLLTTNKRVAESEAVPLKRETEDNDSTEPVLNTTTNYLKRRKSNSDIDPLKIEIDTFDSRNNSSDDSVPVDKDSDNSDEEDS